MKRNRVFDAQINTKMTSFEQCSAIYMANFSFYERLRMKGVLEFFGSKSATQKKDRLEVQLR